MALSKNDIHALRHGDVICVHLGGPHKDGLVRVIKHKPSNAKPFEQDQEHVLTIGDAVRYVGSETARGKAALDRGNAFFAHISYYRDQQCRHSSVLETLRVGDEIGFSFYPDGHANQYVAQAGLHADVLYLNVYRKGKRRARFEIASSICPNNSARMCRGVERDKLFFDKAS